MDLELPASHFLSIHPDMFFIFVTALLWGGTLLGGYLRRRRETHLAEETNTFKTLESAVLALLGLLLGFTFSMGVGRYDQRKGLEIAEANAISTVWLRTATLPQPTRVAAQSLLRQYVSTRIEFLAAGTSRHRIAGSLQQTGMLQHEIWRLAGTHASAHPDLLTAQWLTALTEMFDLSESRTAAFENRIPILAWCMLLFIAFVASILVGFVLPIVVASALSLTLDLDSPRSGFIRVHQRSLERVAAEISAGPLP